VYKTIKEYLSSLRIMPSTLSSKLINCGKGLLVGFGMKSGKLKVIM
jgi:hypothetical protein